MKTTPEQCKIKMIEKENTEILTTELSVADRQVLNQQNSIIECLLLSNGQSKGWKSLQIHGIGYLLIHNFFRRTNDNLYSEEFLNKFTSSKKYKIFTNYLINN